ncbi:FecR family protein [Pseudoflavitalea rhizosphaerae]|uniref:FecR family protein n=1 Tax=Pseudoflavitalea rhizosphaerae TaxID=1884793 RepID=UPI000F8DEEF1|nr:FecR family protein [Pseudoflavitalea rhizosphaerae]
MDKVQFYSLYQAFLEDRMGPGELQQFRDYCQQQPYEQWLDELLDNTIALEFAAMETPEINLGRMRNHLLENVVGITPKKTPVKYYYAAAASLVVLLAAAFYLWLKPTEQQQLAEQTIQSAAEIQPARDIATLTLSDGSTILLDSAGLQRLSAESSITAAPAEDGSLSFQTGNTATAGMNELSTPRGGQFKITLPDGTRAWLNAASSIIFPTAFTGKNRPVKITGEVYLEVKQDQLHPFIVETGNETVEVLGTSFNINAYADEGKILTTLIDGSIRIRAGKSVIMKPGQQAWVSLAPGNTAEPQLINTVDIQKVMAWKNGFFNFDNMPLPEVMKQLERWYDIDIKYDGPVPDVTFRGGMDREVKLSGIIRFLTGFGIHAKLEGRTLHIYRK